MNYSSLSHYFWLEKFIQVIYEVSDLYSIFTWFFLQKLNLTVKDNALSLYRSLGFNPTCSVLTLKRLGGVNLIPPVFFPRICYLEREWKPVFLVTFNIIISHIFPENFIEITQVIQKIWRFSPLILTIFMNFSDFLLFFVAKKLMTSAHNR